LQGCWRWLSPVGRQHLTRATSSYSIGGTSSNITAGLIEFYLGWLEQTSNESDVGGILGTLCRMPKIASGGVVKDVERAFPATGSDPPLRFLRTWTFPEYYVHIRPRLDRIARDETEPKLTPQVARYWGVR
jgi:hypothetical protein